MPGSFLACRVREGGSAHRPFDDGLGSPVLVARAAGITGEGEDGSIAGCQERGRKQYGLDQALVDCPFLRLALLVSDEKKLKSYSSTILSKSTILSNCCIADLLKFAFQPAGLYTFRTVPCKPWHRQPHGEPLSGEDQRIWPDSEASNLADLVRLSWPGFWYRRLD